MSKTVTVKELRENLEELIAEVEQGETLTVVRETNGLTLAQRGVRFPFRGFDPGPPLDLPTDAVAALIEERDWERSNKKYGL